MKTSAMITAAVGAALLGSGLANAAGLVLPSTGNSNLLFFVTDTKTNQTYTDVLTEDMNGYFSAAQTTASTPVAGVDNVLSGDANFSVNLATDSNLTTFLSAAGSDALAWGIEAGAITAASGNANRPIGAARYITTNTIPGNELTVAQSTITGGMAGGVQTDYQTLNNNLGGVVTTGSTTNGVLGTSTSLDGTALDLYTANVAQGVAVGQSTTLFGITGNGGKSGYGYAYSLGTVGFTIGSNGDVLNFTGNGSPVPLPAAVWLFGSGLLGLAGVGRRRAGSVA